MTCDCIGPHDPNCPETDQNKRIAALEAKLAEVSRKQAQAEQDEVTLEAVLRAEIRRLLAEVSRKQAQAEQDAWDKGWEEGCHEGGKHAMQRVRELKADLAAVRKRAADYAAAYERQGNHTVAGDFREVAGFLSGADTMTDSGDVADSQQATKSAEKSEQIDLPTGDRLERSVAGDRRGKEQAVMVADQIARAVGDAGLRRALCGFVTELRARLSPDAATEKPRLRHKPGCNSLSQATNRRADGCNCGAIEDAAKEKEPLTEAEILAHNEGQPDQKTVCEWTPSKVRPGWYEAACGNRLRGWDYKDLQDCICGLPIKVKESE